MSLDKSRELGSMLHLVESEWSQTRMKVIGNECYRNERLLIERVDGMGRGKK